MWIGAGKLVLDFHSNDLLRLKKKQLEQLFKELKKKYNLSILEVADEDDVERCVIGFATVMPEDWREVGAKGFVQKIIGTIDEISFARISVDEWQVYWFDKGAD